jgi:hypothetical protein
MSKKVIEIGSCEAILSKISTRVDGSVTISLEINPNDQAIVGKLMNAYLEGDKLLTVGFIKVFE